MNNNRYNLDNLRKLVEQEKGNNNYVVIDNLGVDFRNLQKLDAFSISVIKSDNINHNWNIGSFEECLYNHCMSLEKRNIPYDVIHISGAPGFIIDGNKLREMLAKYMKYHYDSLNGEFDDEVLSEEELLGCYNYSLDCSSFVRPLISDLKISDTLYNYVPLNFTFEPFYRIGDEDVSSYEFLKIEKPKVNSYKKIVTFNEFVSRLREDGFCLRFDDREIKTYNDYFNSMIASCDFGKHLNIDVDLSNDNNIRR